MNDEQIVIAGGPLVGKTTLADVLAHGRKIRHSDDSIHLGWSEASEEVATWLDYPGRWIVEGVATPRALRKWLKYHPKGRPCSVVIWMAGPPFGALAKGQITMSKGCETVWREIISPLLMRGVAIDQR
jgi:hypothetical protein